MRRNRILYALGISAFIIILGYALLRELDRNQAQISNSISGVITATPAAGAGIVKTDNAYLLLFEPGSSYPGSHQSDQPLSPADHFFHRTGRRIQTSQRSLPSFDPF